MKISNQTVVIITGASSGIGKELALALSRKGARLGLIARRADKLNDVAWEGMKKGATDVWAMACDITDRTAYSEAIEEIITGFGRVDVLVNNAGVGHVGYVEDTPDEHIESVFAVNAFALWYGASVVLPHMKRQKNGQIITISSLAGVMPFPANAAYVAAKHAAVGFTRALRSELAGTGIDAMVVLPAGTTTDWSTLTEGGPILPLFEYEGKRGAEIAAELEIETPDMPSLLPPEEIARQIMELIEHPVPEYHTHPGSRELAEEYRVNQLELENRLHPFWLANREGYLRLQDKRREEAGST